MAKVATKKKRTAKTASPEMDAASETVEAQSTPEQLPADQQLSLGDLQVLAQAVDLASRRGAFGAADMGEVGRVYTKLTNFLNAIAKQQEEQGQEGE